MNVCSIRMKNYLPKHADVVIAYAVKHNYPEIIGEAALLLLDKPLRETIAILPANLIIPWVCYYDQWNQTLTDGSDLSSQNREK